MAGKGGVGKTTVSAALARAAARAGLAVLVVEVEGKSGLAAAHDRPDLGYDESELWAAGDPPGAGPVRARALTADDALLEYLADHGLRRLSRRLVGSGALQMVSTAAPGIEDILLLGKVKQLERAGVADLIVLDTPAAGHAVTFLRSVRGLLDAVSVGPIRAQASDVLELLTDPARCRVVLVTLPEETPVNELVETAYRLEDEVGVALGPVVVNQFTPPLPGLDVELTGAAGLDDDERRALDRAGTFRRRRAALQDEQVARLARALPLPQLRLPAVLGVDVGRHEIDRLARALLDEVRALDAAAVAEVSGGGS